MKKYFSGMIPQNDLRVTVILTDQLLRSLPFEHRFAEHLAVGFWAINERDSFGWMLLNWTVVLNKAFTPCGQHPTSFPTSRSGTEPVFTLGTG